MLRCAARSTLVEVPAEERPAGSDLHFHVTIRDRWANPVRTEVSFAETRVVGGGTGTLIPLSELEVVLRPSGVYEMYVPTTVTDDYEVRPLPFDAERRPLRVIHSTPSFVSSPR